MRTVNIYDKNDKVMIKGTIVAVDVDSNGIHKYRIKDDKSAMIFDTWYSGDEIVPFVAENEKKVIY